jgi:hypothetical protein
MVGWRNSFVLLARKIITEVIFATAIALLARRITKAIFAMVIALLARTIITEVIFATAIALLAWRITKAIFAMAIALLAWKIITEVIFVTNQGYFHCGAARTEDHHRGHFCDCDRALQQQQQPSKYIHQQRDNIKRTRERGGKSGRRKHRRE